MASTLGVLDADIAKFDTKPFNKSINFHLITEKLTFIYRYGIN
jgi:hypothetical protein